MGCKVIKLGENTTAFICGGKPDHTCDEKAGILMLKSGERVEDTPANQEKYRNDICGGSVACSICGGAAIDNAPFM
jgi:hypothetical protein